MAGVWLHSALWLGLALLASLISIRVMISVALIEIVVGAVAGNLVGLQITDWVNFLAGFGAILLTPRRNRNRSAHRQEALLVEHDHRRHGLFRALSRGARLCAFLRRLGVAAGANLPRADDMGASRAKLTDQVLLSSMRSTRTPTARSPLRPSGSADRWCSPEFGSGWDRRGPRRIVEGARVRVPDRAGRVRRRARSATTAIPRAIAPISCG